MGIFDFFKKKKDTTPKRPAAIDTMSKADAITQAASQAAEAKANEEMDELTRLALAAGVENGMTLQDFKAYRAFRTENQLLKEDFRVNEHPHFAFYEFAIDTEHRLFCTTLQLDKTIFKGEQIKSFVIREDTKPLFEGGPDGLIRHASMVPQTARALGPQIAQYKMQREMFRAM